MKTHVVFLGFALPEDEFGRLVAADVGLPMATQRFAWSVIESLTSAGLQVTLLSAAPSTDFPHNRRVFFSAGRFDAGEKVTGFLLPFVNITGLKHISRYISASWGLDRRTRRGATSAILVHGVHSPFIWAALRAGRRLKVPVVVLLTDPPSLRTAFDYGPAPAMKRVDRRLIQSGLAKVSGVISLTAPLADDFAPGKPALVMEGIARPVAGATNTTAALAPVGTTPIAVYAGGLQESYGVRALMGAVSLSQGAWELHLYGRGPLEAECRRVASVNPRVFFHGVADATTLASAYARAAVLVNPRQLGTDFVLYSFPSKVLEYMTTGTPVVTTHLPTIPADYDPFVVYSDDDPASLAAALDEVLRQDRQQLEDFGAAAAEFAQGTRSTRVQGTRMSGFLNDLARSRGDVSEQSP